MVLVAGIVFGVAVNGGGEGGNAAQNISINKDGGQPEILTPKPIEPAGGKTRIYNIIYSKFIIDS